MIYLNTIVKKKGKIPWRIIETEAVIVDITKGNVLQLNEVGAEIWNSIDGTRRVEEIINYICDCFEIDEKRAEEDVVEFIEKLFEKGLIYY